MSKRNHRRGAGAPQKRSTGGVAAVLAANWDTLCVPGYTSLMQSPDVCACIDAIADPIANATIQLMQNWTDGDQRVHGALAQFIDIHPYSLGTRQSFIGWLVRYMLGEGDGNAYVLPITSGGYLEDLMPMPGAYAVDRQEGGYTVQYKGLTLDSSQVLHFIWRSDLMRPWMGRGVRIQLRDVLRNIKQAGATINGFLTDQWKPSLIIKVNSDSQQLSSHEGRQEVLEQYIKGQKSGEPWIIPSELMDVVQAKPLSLSDLAIADNVEVDRRCVAAAFGVPPFLVGIGEYNAEAYNNFIRRVVVPIANGIAQVLTKQLLQSDKMYFRFSDRRLYAYSIKELAEVADNQYVRGLMTGNEVRDWIGLNPKSGLNNLVMLENYIPADMIGQQKKLSGGDE